MSKLFTRKITLIASIFVFLSLSFQGIFVQAATTSTYSLLKSTTYEITDVFTVKASSSGKATLNFFIGTLSQSPYQKELSLTTSGENSKVIIDSKGKKVLNSTISVTKGTTKTFKIVRKVQSSGIKYNVNLSKTSGNYSTFKDYKKYTSPEPKIESTNSLIKAKASTLFKGITNPYLKAKKAYEFITLNMNYTYNSNYANKGALSALKSLKGVCEDYSDLFVALLRASGVPARVSVGYWASSEDFVNNIANGSLLGHAWPEYYLPEYGWIPVEPTIEYTDYTGKRIVPYSYFSALPNSDHILTDYYPACSVYSYSSSANILVYTKTTIKKIR